MGPEDLRGRGVITSHLRCGKRPTDKKPCQQPELEATDGDHAFHAN